MSFSDGLSILWNTVSTCVSFCRKSVFTFVCWNFNLNKFEIVLNAIQYRFYELILNIENDKGGFPELKVLHQIPVTWIDDVSSLSVNGEHKFSIKVRGNADELQFRCKDADSMTNWIVTLLSSKDAAVKRPVRLAAQTNNVHVHRTPNNNAKQPPPANTNTTPQPIRSQPAAPSPAPRQHQQAPTSNSNPPKMSIRELRAIAHGEGISEYYY